MIGGWSVLKAPLLRDRHRPVNVPHLHQRCTVIVAYTPQIRANMRVVKFALVILVTLFAMYIVQKISWYAHEKF